MQFDNVLEKILVNMKYFLTIISTIFILASCHIKNNVESAKFQLLLPDTSKTHQTNHRFNYLTDLGKRMNLPKLDTGVYGTKIRLWITSMFTPHLLVTLNITDTSVTAQKFDYYEDPDGIVHFKPSQKGIGGDSLQLLAEELEDIDFTKMISQVEIANFDNNVADGIYYNLEVATSKYYKLLTYHCPEHFAKTEYNNKKFLDIIFMLDRHLHFYSPICAF
jgi:hypothetical protein